MTLAKSEMGRRIEVHSVYGEDSEAAAMKGMTLQVVVTVTTGTKSVAIDDVGASIQC